jgi:hypothetical protein
MPAAVEPGFVRAVNRIGNPLQPHLEFEILSDRRGFLVVGEPTTYKSIAALLKAKGVKQKSLKYIYTTGRFEGMSTSKVRQMLDAGEFILPAQPLCGEGGSRSSGSGEGESSGGASHFGTGGDGSGGGSSEISLAGESFGGSLSAPLTASPVPSMILDIGHSNDQPFDFDVDQPLWLGQSRGLMQRKQYPPGLVQAYTPSNQKCRSKVDRSFIFAEMLAEGGRVRCSMDGTIYRSPAAFLRSQSLNRSYLLVYMDGPFKDLTISQAHAAVEDAASEASTQFLDDSAFDITVITDEFEGGGGPSLPDKLFSGCEGHADETELQQADGTWNTQPAIASAEDLCELCIEPLIHPIRICKEGHMTCCCCFEKLQDSENPPGRCPYCRSSLLTREHICERLFTEASDKYSPDATRKVLATTFRQLRTVLQLSPDDGPARVLIDQLYADCQTRVNAKLGKMYLVDRLAPGTTRYASRVLAAKGRLHLPS